LNSQCLPFRQVPHATRLFLDFLDYKPSVHNFFPRSPRFLEWAYDEASHVRQPADRRKRVAEILERQNRGLEASAATLQNISRFREGAMAVVTGQQVGLFGGPAFSLYKALSAVKLANEARCLGVDCVPVFWLATEDHDLDEVNQAGIPTLDGALEPLKSSAFGGKDAPVGAIRFNAEISQTVEHAAALIGDSEITALLRETYRAGETFGSAFAKLFAKLFAEFGVILLDGSDPELDSIAKPVFQAAIDRSQQLNHALLSQDEGLNSAQYHQQVRITDSSTLFFVFKDGARVPVHAQAKGNFLIGDGAVSRRELLDLCESAPESFSPNVLLRPVIQDYLLPTLAYVGGSAEVAYFAQAKAVYQALLQRTTPIVPRFSATLIETKPKALLDKYKLAPQEVFLGPTELGDKIASRLLPPNLQSSFEEATRAVERSMSAVEQSLGLLDKTLTESARNAQSKMLYQITNLRARAARAELRQAEIVGRHAEFLSASLYPEKSLQEREFAGVYFLAKHGSDLLHQLLATIHPDCLDHQWVTLD
jgi:bacillithiol biosynthesis cysteine-adding enzyme BshC